MTVDPAINALLTALSDGLSTRFRNMFDDDSYHIATMLIPKFKLRYLPEYDRHVKKLVMTQAVCAVELTNRNGLYYQKMQLLQSGQNSNMTMTICMHFSLMIPRCLHQALKMS